MIHPERLNSDEFTIRSKLVGMIANTWVPLLSPDPTRWAVLFSQAGASALFLANDMALATSTGLALPPNVLPLIFYYSAHAILTTSPWFGSGAPGVTAYVTEILYRPPVVLE